jgi:hypothetical protein
MDATKASRRVTSSTGDIDKNGDVVGAKSAELFFFSASGLLERAYLERPGLDDRIREAGADPAAVRRLLRVPA